MSSKSLTDKTGGSLANRGFDSANRWKCQKPIIVGVVALNTLPHQRTIMATHTEDNIYIKHCKSDASKKVKSSDDHLADQNIYQIFRLDLLKICTCTTNHSKLLPRLPTYKKKWVMKMSRGSEHQSFEV